MPVGGIKRSRNRVAASDGSRRGPIMMPSTVIRPTAPPPPAEIKHQGADKTSPADAAPAADESSAADEPQLVADAVERAQRDVELLARVGGGHDRAKARLVDGDGREDDGLGEDTLLDEPVAEASGRVGVAHHHRGDRRLGATGVEA